MNHLLLSQINTHYWIFSSRMIYMCVCLYVCMTIKLIHPPPDILPFSLFRHSKRDLTAAYVGVQESVLMAKFLRARM